MEYKLFIVKNHGTAGEGPMLIKWKLYKQLHYCSFHT
jgi:hypothetical protein